MKKLSNGNIVLNERELNDLVAKKVSQHLGKRNLNESNSTRKKEKKVVHITETKLVTAINKIYEELKKRGA